jgi:hypothetical protein
MPFDLRSPFDGARGDLELVERSRHPEHRRGVRATTVCLVVAACVGVFGGVSPAYAQVDLSGMAPIFHEDQVGRVPGPERIGA